MKKRESDTKSEPSVEATEVNQIQDPQIQDPEQTAKRGATRRWNLLGLIFALTLSTVLTACGSEGPGAGPATTEQGEPTLAATTEQGEPILAATTEQGEPTLAATTEQGEPTLAAATEEGGSAATPGPASTETDREALIALYNATDGANWHFTKKWLSDAPIDEWGGVTTYGTGRVIELRLFARNLAGHIPPELGNLEYLRVLDLSQNVLSGPIPPELGNLANLDRLFVASPLSELPTGCIPAKLLRVPENDLSRLFAPICGAAGGSAASDRDALTALYRATDGANWTDNDNWLSDAPIGEWRGVETDASGRVIRLRLGNRQLSGEIPPEMGNLTNLGFLALSNNQLTGPIPPELGNLTSLTGLWLQDNQLSGPVPPQLGSLTGLQWLDLSNNQLSGPIPSELGKLVYLRFLIVNGNQLSDNVPEELGNMVYLSWVFIQDNRLGGCLPAQWQSVQGPNNDLGPLGLPFCETQRSTAGSNLSGDGAVLASLYNATGGENWLFKYGWLSDAPIGEWHGVTTDENGRVIGLNLNRNGLSGEIPPGLGQLSSLTWLDLSGNDLGGEIPPELGNLAKLRWLSLGGNSLEGEIPPELESLASLRGLLLDRNSLSGEIPTELSNLSGLRSLNLSHNTLSGEIPPEFGQLSSLKSLVMSNSGVVGEIPAELGNLGDLEILALGSNDLSGEIPSQLGQLASLIILGLEDTLLSGCIPDPLQEQLGQGSTLGHIPFCTAEVPADTPTATPEPTATARPAPTATANRGPTPTVSS